MTALPAQNRKYPIAKDNGLFQINHQTGMFPAVGNMPMTTFVSMVPGKNEIIMGSFGEKGNLACFNTDGTRKWSQDFPSAPTWVDFSKPYALPGYDIGRWLTMDAADVDGDGDQDLVLGNLSMGPESFMSQEQVKKFAAGPACLFLKNTTR